MTSKERVLAAINHQQPDRVPIQTYLTPEIDKILKEHFKTDDILSVLGVDLRAVGPRYIGPERPVPEGCAMVDEWGTGYKTIQFETGAYEEAAYLPLAAMETLDEVEAHPWPTRDQYDFSNIEEQCDALSEFAVCYGGAGTPDIVNGVSRGRGMERVVMDIATEDPVGVAIIDKRCEVLYEQCRCALEAAHGKIDILCLGEDCGNQAGPMFSPEVFDRYIHRDGTRCARRHPARTARNGRGRDQGRIRRPPHVLRTDQHAEDATLRRRSRMPRRSTTPH